MYKSLETTCNRESYTTIDKMTWIQKIKLSKRNLSNQLLTETCNICNKKLKKVFGNI